MRIKQCDPNSTNSRPCVNQTVINNLSAAFGGTFIASLYYVNPLINPGSKNYLEYEVNDRNFFTFTLQQGGAATGYAE